MRYSHVRLAAFTLAELSIVLVLVGLLVGGIIAGKSLIHASELRNATTTIGKYNSAVNLFQNEFKALPGDMPNATQYWGVANSSAVVCATTDSLQLPDPQVTCNGNGDGVINGSGYLGIASRFEIYRAWQHLTNAGLIEGRFTGVIGPNDPTHASVPDVNVPAGKLNGSGFDFWDVGTIPDVTTSGLFPGVYGNPIVFGSTAGDIDIALYPILTPTEAESIDKKLDDGNPATGMVRTVAGGAGWAPNCATSATSTNADYNVQLPDVACSLIIITGY